MPISAIMSCEDKVVNGEVVLGVSLSSNDNRGLGLCCLMTPGPSKDIQCHV